jgi:glycosyltransferase involved in cell wall biosynthesis
MVRLYTALVSRAARAADLIITDSRASRRDIVTHLGLPAERVRTIYLAAGDAYTPQPSTQDRMIRKQYEVPETYVLYLGGFDVRKNVETIIQAYGRAREAHSSFCPLVIAGRLPAQDTPFTPDPRRLAHEADLPEESILFPGYIEEDDKPALYRGAVVFLFPSLYEGFGLPPLEAMACGVPVVASNAGSLPEIVGDGGALFAAGDQQSIASELAKLINNPTYRGQRSQQAVRTASRFSWDQTIEETTAALRSISMES